MPPTTRYRIALIVVLAGAGLIEPSDPWATVGLLLFGVMNALLPSTTTRFTPPLAVSAVCIALVGSRQLETTMIVLIAVLWPPLFLFEWILTRDATEPADETPFGPSRHARIATAAIIVAVAIASFTFRLLVVQGLHQSAALFIGIPTLLAVVVVFVATPRSATGVACKAVTVGLLVAMIFLGEGVLCILMSAPLFYVVAIILGKSIDKVRGEDEGTTYSLRTAIPVVVLIVMSLEGVHHTTSFGRDESVTVIKTVAAPADTVARALFERPRFERALPQLLQAGFPRPIATEQQAPRAGARWTIVFRGGEMRIDGHEPRIGDLTLELVEAQPGLARWRALGDDSHMTHYLAWQGSTVRWTPVSPAETRVEWTLHYRRSLDPAWYFGPMERFAVRLAAGYLIDSVATP